MSDTPETPQEPVKPDVEVLADRGHERGDSILAQRAIREKWPITPEVRRKLVVRSLDIAEYSEDHRAANAAVKNVVEMDKVNMEKDAQTESGATATGISGSTEVTKTETRTTTYRFTFDSDG